MRAFKFPQVSPSSQAALQKLFMAGLCFHCYQQISYMILQRVSPVTHSVGNCVKRVLVVLASVLIFLNPMSSQSLTGTAMAMAGVLAFPLAAPSKSAQQ